MPNRMDIELTSQTPDGGWTWRAAGARQPRGSVGADLVPEGAKVGDVLRAELEIGIEGLEVVTLQASRPQERPTRHETIEIIGPERRAPDVSVALVSGARRRRQREEPEDRRWRERRGGAGGEGRRARGGAEGEGRDRGERRGVSPRRGAQGRERGPRTDERRQGAGRERRPAQTTVHRNAALAALKPEEVPVAEELLRGGLPAVRQAIEEQNARATSEGRPTVASEPLLAAAERLVPLVNLASWKDRASAAQSAGKELRLRELRAVVAASRAVALDDEGRTMSKALQQSLDQRVAALRQDWLDRLDRSMEEGRIADALETAARAPEPGTRLPAEKAVRLAQAAGAALVPEMATEEWTALLDAVVASPVRRTVKPAGIPDDDRARAAALAVAGVVPDLARQLGLPLPPPPSRRPAVRERVGAGRGARPRGGGAPADAS